MDKVLQDLCEAWGDGMTVLLNDGYSELRFNECSSTWYVTNLCAGYELNLSQATDVKVREFWADLSVDGDCYELRFVQTVSPHEVLRGKEGV